MKNTFRIFGIIALAAVIGFAFAACGDADSGNSTSKTYSGNGYTLTIKENPNNPNRAFTPLAGDFYELRKGKTSKGIVDGIEDNTFYLWPEGAEDAFKVMVSGSTISGVVGDIRWEDGTTDFVMDIPPITVSTTSGRLTISEFGSGNNGKYAFAMGYDETNGKELIAANSIATDFVITGTTITSGSAELKVWEYTESYLLINYNGTGDVVFTVYIANKATVTMDEVAEFLNERSKAYWLPAPPSWLVALGISEATFDSGIGNGAFVLEMEN
ncbi:MAG: hypothetical protein LBG94_10130 [Treponema sp.]|jgi:hypothetical protein|nr:hypothetical protein [Treponema sp.]